MPEMPVTRGGPACGQVAKTNRVGVCSRQALHRAHGLPIKSANRAGEVPNRAIPPGQAEYDCQQEPRSESCPRPAESCLTVWMRLVSRIPRPIMRRFSRLPNHRACAIRSRAGTPRTCSSRTRRALIFLSRWKRTPKSISSRSIR